MLVHLTRKYTDSYPGTLKTKATNSCKYQLFFPDSHQFSIFSSPLRSFLCTSPFNLKLRNGCSIYTAIKFGEFVKLHFVKQRIEVCQLHDQYHFGSTTILQYPSKQPLSSNQKISGFSQSTKQLSHTSSSSKNVNRLLQIQLPLYRGY